MIGNNPLQVREKLIGDGGYREGNGGIVNYLNELRRAWYDDALVFGYRVSCAGKN